MLEEEIEKALQEFEQNHKDLKWELAKRKLRIKIHDDSLLTSEEPQIHQETCIYWTGWKGTGTPVKGKSTICEYSGVGFNSEAYEICLKYFKYKYMIFKN